MENMHQKVRQQIEGVLSQQCGGVKGEQVMAQLEGLNVIYAVRSLIVDIEKRKQGVIQQLKQENWRLRAKFN